MENYTLILRAGVLTLLKGLNLNLTAAASNLSDKTRALMM
ncbi:hypothetical protein CAMSH0001_1880 [Campylobacter showae RM3277]|uniref:Uncharacterized protein n=1 Tax=Campylobacter showae RM3277 TaxID=553219 RepID=C6RDG4_9BACT|nr:hypothetical protein CAMSH0001_1880 [Campylobacter showae RM3277]